MAQTPLKNGLFQGTLDGTPSGGAINLSNLALTLGSPEMTTPFVTTIELGHASDTTLARVSAGVVSIEGVTIATATNTLTLSGKTLTAPKIASGGFIADANGNELIKFTTTTSAVNEVTLANAATGSNPTFTASGGDSNIGINFTAKGTGIHSFTGSADFNKSAASGPRLRLINPSSSRNAGLQFCSGGTPTVYWQFYTDAAGSGGSDFGIASGDAGTFKPRVLLDANGGIFYDANGNESLIMTTTASAVNEVTLANAATGGNPTWTASGGDTNVGVNFAGKGTGTFKFSNSATTSSALVNCLCPSMGTSHGVYMSFGVALSPYDSASIGYVYGGGGSSASYLSISLYGQTPTCRFYNNRIYLEEGNGIELGTTTGSKFGTAANQKIGKWGATPIVQPTTSVASATVAGTGSGDIVAASTTFDGYTIPQLVRAMRIAGNLA